MNHNILLKYIGAAAAALLLLSGCDALLKTASSAPEGKVVTLADGRKVIVQGSTQQKSLIPPSSSKVASSKSSAAESKKQSPAIKNAGGKQGSAIKSPGGKQSADVKSTEGKNKGAPAKPKKAGKENPAPAKDREAVGTIVIGTDAPVAVTDTVKAPDPAVYSGKVEDVNINGEWTIYSVRDNVVTGEERPYLTIDLPVHRFYGNNGCNYINGDISVAPGAKISFDNMIATMKMCQDDQFQYLINLAVDEVKSYALRNDGPITFLDLKDNSGRVILVLRRHNMDFLNGAWKVTELNGKALQGEDDATMTFDTSELKIHGTTGCNIFNGQIFIDPDKTNSLQIIGLATTRMACPQDDIETEFLLALEEVETARQINQKGIALYSADGSELFKLQKLSLRSIDSPE